MSDQSEIRFLRISEVARLTSYSTPSTRRLVDEGKFPKPRKIGERRVAWLESEIQSWLHDRVRGIR